MKVIEYKDMKGDIYKCVRLNNEEFNHYDNCMNDIEEHGHDQDWDKYMHERIGLVDEEVFYYFLENEHRYVDEEFMETMGLVRA